ncbi:CreA family protein [Parvularcula dongshanensis]|uniref:CreA protein n=1 Tax=Parvularcula dongshanensis TaxID=1173995 RepID=A0A840I670_9PROT|nr:CreA family protein [Parvularcula dongshanensis]MBB4659753.1 CreA protein [Parvularcula dongshanensis]
MRRRLAALTLLPFLAACGGDDEVGEFKNDFLGNEIKVEAMADPDVEGVTCHITYFDRGVLDRAKNGNWFEDPSNSSIACRQTGPIVIGDIDMGRGGESVFSQSRSIVLKSIIVRRIYDPQADTLMYIAYSRRPVEGSAKMSLSTVALYGQDVTWTGGKPEAS